MRYAKINKMDTTNGIGIACSLFLQGCKRHCKNCFNKDTWPFDKGKELTDDVINSYIELCRSDTIDCVSILGGEPFDNADIYAFVKRLHDEVKKPILMWSGYTYTQLITNGFNSTLELIDYLIDGEYVDELKNAELWLRGSSNQRVIDVQGTLRTGMIKEKREPYT